MSNVVPIGMPRSPNLSQRQGLLLENFATRRRDSGDVFWLKENAEILNVLASSGACIAPDHLKAYATFYANLEEKLRFFPQYYRFLLSICLDLEDLGVEGTKGEALCQWAAARRLDDAELSDLQRAEAQRLFARRGAGAIDETLASRLHRFIDHSETFALPNKKAAYELTHIVFYLSDYGQRDPALSGDAVRSLEFAGVLAYLDQDVDILAEVCVAMRFAQRRPSEIWEDWLRQQMGSFDLAPSGGGAETDAYHEYLVTSWWARLSGEEGFTGAPQQGGLQINRYGACPGPLRAISEYMFHMGRSDRADWPVMKTALENVLGADDFSILSGAVQSSVHFDAFFEGFARADK